MKEELLNSADNITKDFRHKLINVLTLNFIETIHVKELSIAEVSFFISNIEHYQKIRLFQTLIKNEK